MLRHTHTHTAWVCPHLRPRGEEGAGHTVHVLGVDLDADVFEAHSVEAEATPQRAKVTLAGVRRDGDGVVQVTARQVVGGGAVHVALGGSSGPEVRRRCPHSLHLSLALFDKCEPKTHHTAVLGWNNAAVEGDKAAADECLQWATDISVRNSAVLLT